ncbi:MAG: serine/threonine protein kinase [Geminicoccaceae bacterium]
MTVDPSPAHEDDGFAVSGVGCVSWRGSGILVQGPPASGKSDLVLRVIGEGGVLVADDVVWLQRRQSGLFARHLREPGLIELRGQGIFRLPCLDESRIDIVIRLVASVKQERLPDVSTVWIAGIELPAFDLDGLAPSAIARIATILDHPRVA